MLRKLARIGAAEPGEASDIELAEEKLRMVHGYLKTQDIVRWTLQDIPDYAEEPYVMMAAFYASPEFEMQADPTFWTFGLRQLQSAVVLPADHTATPAAYF